LGALPLLMLIITATWLSFIFATYVVFYLIVPIEPSTGAPYVVALEYAILKLLLTLVVFFAWLYSYYFLRDAFVRYKGLIRSPISSSSGRTPS
jgi:hypothetical protein